LENRESGNLPELYDDADTGTEPRFLDKEFRDILNTADPEIRTSLRILPIINTSLLLFTRITIVILVRVIKYKRS
jgi:hypothetical protein